MMSIRKQLRLKAFTVIELMVALVLTALTVSFVYAGLRFVQQQTNGLTQQLADFDEFNRLHTALQSDANRADEIWYSDSGIDFHSPHQPVRFIPFDSVCVRSVSALAADTFRIRVDSVSYWFGGSRQAGAAGPIDQAFIHVVVSEHPLVITLHKVYDATTLITLTTFTTTDEQRY